jgi:hypothetical protein
VKGVEDIDINPILCLILNSEWDIEYDSGADNVLTVASDGRICIKIDVLPQTHYHAKASPHIQS